MELKLLTSIRSNDGLKLEWDNLVDVSGVSVFSRYDFSKNVEELYGDLIKPRVYLAYEQNELVGIAPFAEENGVLRFLTGLEYKSIADYSDFIVHPKFSLEVMAEFSKVLQDSGKFNLKDIPENSRTLDYFTENNIGVIKDSKERTSFINLPNNFEEYYDGLRSSYKKGLRKIWVDFSGRKIKDERELLKVRSRDFSNIFLERYEKDFDERFNQFILMHQEEWNGKGLSGCFAEDEKHTRFKDYHKSLARDLLKDGLLSLTGLIANDKVFAMEYGFKYKKTLYNYLGAVNPSISSRYSPGKAITIYLIENCINEGINRFDYLRGYEEYKTSFGATWTQNKDVSSS